MANAQLRSPWPAYDKRESSPAETVESDNTKSDDSKCEVDNISVADKTEDGFRRQWSSEDIRNDKSKSGDVSNRTRTSSRKRKKSKEKQNLY